MMIGTLTGAAAIAAAFLMPFEGLHNVAYLDPPAVATICYGHTKGVTINMTATDTQCAAFLGEDVKDAEAAFNRAVVIKVSDKTKAAFISFVFNAGKGNFSKSTMLKKLNAGDVVGACNELTRWVYSGGKKLNGLVHRREAEQALCLSGVK